MDSLAIENKQDGFLEGIFEFVFFCLALYHVFPFFRSLPQNTYLEFLIFGVWVLGYFLVQGKKLDFRGYLGGAVLFALYTITVPRIFGNGVLSNRYASVAVGFTFYLTYLHLRENGRIAVGWKIIKWISPFYLFAVIRTSIALLQNPWIARNIKSSGEMSVAILRQGIGGYQLIYMSVVIVAILLYLLLNTRGSRLGGGKKLLLLVLTAGVAYLILLSNYFTAFGLMFICLGLCVMLLVYRAASWPGFLICGIGLLLFWMYGTDALVWILEKITGLLGKGRTLERLTITLHELQNNEALSIFGSRDYTIERSRELFQTNFLLGTCVKPGLTAGGMILGVGQHSHIWDTLAFYGLPAGFLGIYLYIKPFWDKWKEGGQYRGIALVVGAAAMILLYANNYSASICFVAYFVFPMVFDYLKPAEEG